MSEFFNSSKKVIKRFLQNVVIIDDALRFVDEETSKTNIPKKINVPGKAAKPVSTEGKKLEVKDIDEKHPIYAKKFIDQFSKNDLLCSFIKPSLESDGNLKLYSNALKKADILILDWHLGEGDDGASVKKFIKSLINNEPEHFKTSMRYIAIYSGEENLNEKMQEIKQELKDMNIKDELAENQYKFKAGHLIISIFAKEYEDKVTDREIMKNEEQLTDEILNDFVKEFHGIVPNLALKSLADIRENTHRLLTMFSKDLDPAFLTHRGLLPEPNDAENHINNLISLEIQSILDENQTIHDDQLNSYIEEHPIWKNNSYLKEIYKKCYFDKNIYKDIDDFIDKSNFCTIPEDFLLEKLDETEQIDTLVKVNEQSLKDKLKEDVKACISKGSGNLKIHKAHKIFQQPYLTSLFLNNDTDSKNINGKFSLLTTTKTFYNNCLPYLTLGTILKDSNNKYWLSILPRCDATRVDGNISIPVLKLSKRGVLKKHHIVIKDGRCITYLEIDYSPKNMKTITLKGSDSKPICVNEEKKFVDIINENYYLWLGELKFDKAQMISNNFARELSRVGINESEQLRRSYQ